MNKVVSLHAPRPLQRSDFVPLILQRRPRIGQEELQVRASLLFIASKASSTKEIACEPSWHILNVVQTQASDAANNFAVPLDDLREIRRLCLNCVASASSFDTIFRPRGDAPEAA